jgi:hypothetical protein
MLRIYTLCLAGIIGLGLGAAGCSGSSHPPAGNFELHWNAGATCAAAGATDIYLYLVDTRNNYGYQEHFACPAYQGTSEPLPPDDYTARVQVTDASGTLLDELIFPDVYPIYAGSVTRLLPDVDLVAQTTVIQPPAGTFGLRWSLAWTTGGGTTCSAAGAATVDLDLQDTRGYSYHDTFACSDYQDTSRPLSPDDYTVAVRAYDANDVLLSEWVGPSTYHIYAGSVTQLPDVVLQVQ